MPPTPLNHAILDTFRLCVIAVGEKPASREAVRQIGYDNDLRKGRLESFEVVYHGVCRVDQDQKVADLMADEVLAR